MWNESTLEMVLDKRTKKPVPRPALSQVLCEHHADLCPKGHWSNPKEMSKRNVLAYNHYQRCKATMSFPEDEIVRANAAAIYQIERVMEISKGPLI